MNKNKVLIIGIDGNEANISLRVGVHQYTFELLKALHRLLSEKYPEIKVVVYLKEQPVGDLPSQNDNWSYEILPGGGFWIVKNLMPTLLSAKCDVFFSPNHYLPPISRIPQVCTIHDLGYLKFSAQFKIRDFWQLKYWSAISIFISKYIIAVSDFTKKDIVRHYHFASNKVFTVHHGIDISRFSNKLNSYDVRRILNKYSLSENYLLFLSLIKPSKNLDGILKAYATLLKDKNLPDLVVCGKKGWLYENLDDLVDNLNLKKRVKFIDYISEEEKPLLISGCRALVSPSFWEGFGMHVLEAMACGKPVVISKVASLPEIAGQNAIYVDAYSIKSIAEGMRKVINLSSKEYNIISEGEIKQARKFNWQNTAEKTLNILIKAQN